MSDSAATLFHDALDLVRDEVPEADLALRQAIGARVVSLTIGEESFRLAFGSVSSREAPHLDIRTRAGALRDVLVGARDLHDAVLDDSIAIFGAADDLVAGAEAALCFMKGVARCVSVDVLLQRLERLSDREGT